ncbi:hypothetical protein ACRAWG_20735 [Methylobacterium sp. P31]
MSQLTSEILLVPRGEAGHFLPAALDWMGKGISVTADPGEANHVLCLPVLDFVRLGFPEANGRLDLLQPGDAENLRAGRAALLLDLSNEGPGLHAPTFEALHCNVDGLGIPRDRVILVSQNRMLRLDYERLYGEGLRFWTFEFFPLQVALWLDAEAGPRLFPQHPLDRTRYTPLARAAGPARFLCQNAALRWHRVLLYRWFQLNGMDREGLISFHGIGPDNPKAGGINVFHARPEIEAAFGPLLADVGDWIPRQARRIDAPVQGTDMVMTLDTQTYAECDLTVISETDFFEPRGRARHREVPEGRRDRTALRDGRYLAGRRAAVRARLPHLRRPDRPRLRPRGGSGGAPAARVPVDRAGLVRLQAGPRRLAPPGAGAGPGECRARAARAAAATRPGDGRPLIERLTRFMETGAIVH